MQFSINSELLKSTFQTAKKALSSKPLIVEQNCFRLDLTEDGLLSVQSDDSESHITVKVPIGTEGFQPGAMLVNAGVMLEFLSTLSDAEITLKDNDGKCVNLTWPGGHANIATFGDLKDFPEAPTLDDTAQHYGITQKDLLDGINHTFYATKQDELRPFMSGVRINAAEEGVEMVGTDSCILSIISGKKGTDIVNSSAFTLPIKAASILRGQLNDKSEDPVNIEFDSKHIRFSTESLTFTTTHVSGKYPKYTDVVPKELNNVLICSKKGLTDALRRVSVCSDFASRILTFDFSESGLTISGEDKNYKTSSEETVTGATFKGEPTRIGIKAQALSDILSSIATENVRIYVNGKRPLLITPDTDDDDSYKVVLVACAPRD